MALFDKMFTNIFTDGEVTGYNPDADGDWFYITDYGVDHNYWEAKITDILKSISTDPANDYQIIFGGLVTDGGGGTIDISEGVAIGKDTAGNKRLIHIPALVGVSLPVGWNDNRQIWVIGKYDYKLGAATRNHYNSEVYHYQLEDTYYGDASGYDTPTGSVDLFVDIDPGATVVCWGSFQMTGGGVFTSLDSGERTNQYRVPGESDAVVSSQTEFANVIERTGANAYRFKSPYTSITMAGGTYDFTALLSGGDTWGTLTMNNVRSLIGQGEVVIYVGATNSGITRNIDHYQIKNITINGIDYATASNRTCWYVSTGSHGLIENCGATGIINSLNTVQVFLMNNAMTNIQKSTIHLKDCFIRNCYGILSGFISYGFSYFRSLTNCYVGDLNYALHINLTGYYQCRNLVNCKFNDIIVNYLASIVLMRGFQNCYRLSNCEIDTVQPTGGNGSIFYGFDTCNELSNCSITNLLVAGGFMAGGYVSCSKVSGCEITTLTCTNGGGVAVLSGYASCTVMTACRATINHSGVATSVQAYNTCSQLSACYAYVSTTSTNARGFVGCSDLSACRVQNGVTTGAMVYAFTSCNQLSACYVGTISSTFVLNGSVYGFYLCNYLSACNISIALAGGTGIAYGYHTCTYGSSLYCNPTIVNNPTCDWMDSNDAQIVNKYSINVQFT